MRRSKTSPRYEFHVERGKSAGFADSIAIPIRSIAIHLCRQQRFAGILAPPTLLRTFLYEPKAASEALRVKDWSYIVHGEQEFEYFAPIAAGDVLTAQERIASITEKESRRAGKLQIAVIETTFHNQRGEKVQVARRTLVETGKRIAE